MPVPGAAESFQQVLAIVVRVSFVPVLDPRDAFTQVILLVTQASDLPFAGMWLTAPLMLGLRTQTTGV